MCSLGSNSQYGSIGSENGLVPSRRQAIIWTNDALGYWCIYASLCLNELTYACTEQIQNFLQTSYKYLLLGSKSVSHHFKCHATYYHHIKKM